MGCGISKLERQQNYDNEKERGGMHEYYSEEEEMKEKERSRLVEKVKQRRKEEEEEQLPHARKEGPHGRDFDDDDEQMLSESDREDSVINLPRSPSFRDYCIDSGNSLSHNTPNNFFLDGTRGYAADRTSETSPESRNNKLQGTSEADELVKKESKGRSPSRSRGKQSRIRSYLNVSNWHHFNNPFSSSSQQNPQKLVAGS